MLTIFKIQKQNGIYKIILSDFIIFLKIKITRAIIRYNQKNGKSFHELPEHAAHFRECPILRLSCEGTKDARNTKGVRFIYQTPLFKNSRPGKRSWE